MSCVAHHDESRSRVGQTAFMVAHFRGLETALVGSGRALIDDPFARHFVDEEAENFVQKTYTSALQEMLATGIAVRTRIIDDAIYAALKDGIQQVIVVGAGLDCRPWRLLRPEGCNVVQWFEVDFPEVFDYKLLTLQGANGGKQPHSDFQYNAVSCNVAAERVVDKLIEAGFDPSSRSVWLLEGFTGYLTEEELREALSSFASLTAANSVLLATFLGKTFNRSLATDMHRFFTDDPMSFLAKWGWAGAAEPLSNACERLGRSPAGWHDYYFVHARLAVAP